MPVSDLVSALAYPAVLSAGFIYAGCSAWCRRRRIRRGIPAAGVHPLFVQRQTDKAAAETRELRARVTAEDAERIVAAEFARVAPFYDSPWRLPVDVALLEAVRTNVLFRP